jgi:hypothetical protein
MTILKQKGIHIDFSMMSLWAFKCALNKDLALVGYGF